MKKEKLCEAVTQKYYKAIFQFCLRLLEYDGYAAEECTQEVFVLLIQKKNKLDFAHKHRLCVLTFNSFCGILDYIKLATII